MKSPTVPLTNTKTAAPPATFTDVMSFPPRNFRPRPAFAAMASRSSSRRPRAGDQARDVLTRLVTRVSAWHRGPHRAEWAKRTRPFSHSGGRQCSDELVLVDEARDTISGAFPSRTWSQQWELSEAWRAPSP